ncbi:hypothetical protein GCM10023188_40480 [Pontibacter saemangeumensis]|uniref:Uncharacterized protein n=1 Tax=Pontibacter saemangeumensis TaxID=1084525 RepID=A0ABP8M303_9BACT
MLEYTKQILAKVSFDKMLFEKELKKGLRVLEQEDLLLLEQWCYEEFSDRHLPALGRVFPEVQECLL